MDMMTSSEMRVYCLFKYIHISLHFLITRSGSYPKSKGSLSFYLRVTCPIPQHPTSGVIQASVPGARQRELESLMTIVSWSHKVLSRMLAPDDCGAWSLYRTQCAQAGTPGWLFSWCPLSSFVFFPKAQGKAICSSGLDLAVPITGPWLTSLHSPGNFISWGFSSFHATLSWPGPLWSTWTGEG